MNVFRAYQLSSHRTLGIFSGDEDSVLEWCSLKFNVSEDDVAIERLSVRTITREEVLCFKEMIGQLRDFSSRLTELEGEAEKVGIREDLVDILLDLDPRKGEALPLMVKMLEE
jgi:hypothetical protein